MAVCLFHIIFQAGRCYDPVLWNINYLLQLMQLKNRPVFNSGEVMIRIMCLYSITSAVLLIFRCTQILELQLQPQPYPILWKQHHLIKSLLSLWRGNNIENSDADKGQYEWDTGVKKRIKSPDKYWFQRRLGWTDWSISTSDLPGRGSDYGLVSLNFFLISKAFI